MASEPRIHVRPLAPSDIPAVAALMETYLRETYGARWHGSTEALHRDALGDKCSVHVAVSVDAAVVGFIAWTPSYDLHHCVPGAEVLDLYVQPAWRGRGVALLLACAAAADVARAGGLYMKGGAVETGTALHLYRRFGVCDGANCIVSGRAFRRLAELAGRSVREVVRSLPETSWNHEA